MAERIQSYILQGRKKGFSDQDLKENLVNNGFSEAEVDEAFRSLGPSSSGMQSSSGSLGGFVGFLKSKGFLIGVISFLVVAILVIAGFLIFSGNGDDTPQPRPSPSPQPSPSPTPGDPGDNGTDPEPSPQPSPSPTPGEPNGTGPEPEPSPSPGDQEIYTLTHSKEDVGLFSSEGSNPKNPANIRSIVSKSSSVDKITIQENITVIEPSNSSTKTLYTALDTQQGINSSVVDGIMGIGVESGPASGFLCNNNQILNGSQQQTTQDQFFLYFLKMSYTDESYSTKSLTSYDEAGNKIENLNNSFENLNKSFDFQDYGVGDITASRYLKLEKQDSVVDIGKCYAQETGNEEVTLKAENLVSS